MQVTPFKKPTEEELQKQQEDIKMVYRQFANTVAVNRPDIDIDLVATGEVWYGPDALSRGLVDALQTSSEYIIEKVRGFVGSCRYSRYSPYIALSASQSRLLTRATGKPKTRCGRAARCSR